MNEPSVDVVISSNRATPYLYEAVASVRAQTWAKWQLIIVDDGSPDPDFFDDLGRSVPGSLVVHQPPAGLPAARNTGTRAGEGALIAFLDDDDVWHPERLERQVQALEESPESVAAYSGGWYMDAGGVPFGDAWPASPTPSELFLSGAVNIPRIVTLMVRREVCESIGGFDESFSLGEDDEFILRLVQAGELAAVAAPLVGYRRHATNMTNAAAVDRRKASERLIHLHIANAEARGDARSAALLRENLRRWTERASAECVGSLVSGMRAGRTRLVLNELRWAGTTAPASTARAFLTRGLGALPGRAGAARRAVREAP